MTNNPSDNAMELALEALSGHIKGETDEEFLESLTLSAAFALDAFAETRHVWPLPLLGNVAPSRLPGEHSNRSDDVLVQFGQFHRLAYAFFDGETGEHFWRDIDTDYDFIDPIAWWWPLPPKVGVHE